MKSGILKTPVCALRCGLAGGGFVFCLLAGLTACGSSTSPAGSASVADPILTPAQTKSVTLIHGLGFLCWLDGTSPERIWCWASEQAALDNGDAGRIGLTGLSPVLFYTAPGTTVFQAYDHGICYAGICLGQTTSIASVSYETVTCSVTAADTLHCEDETNKDLTFSGMTFARIEHSPTYKRVRRSV